MRGCWGEGIGSEDIESNDFEGKGIEGEGFLCHVANDVLKKYYFSP